MNWMAAIFSAAALAFAAGGTPPVAQSAQVKRQAQFELETSADKAFPFFSPEGERPWAAGWDPKPVFPAQKTVAWEPNAVFVIERSDQHMVWTVLNVDHANHVAEYVYFVLQSRLVRIRVQVDPIGTERSRVLVNYVLTPLSETGDAFIAAEYSNGAFAQKMHGWQESITAVLKNNEK